MTGNADLLALLSSHGIAILAPLAVIEGPIVTIIAGWFASLGILDVRAVIVVVILADLAGDSLLYLAGRMGFEGLPARWRLSLGLSRKRIVRMARLFRSHGPRIIILGKLTHAAGFAILIAAGAARMPYGSFILSNLIGTVPKSLALVALGWLAGAAHQQIASGIFWVSLIVVGLIALGWLMRHRLKEWFA